MARIKRVRKRPRSKKKVTKKSELAEQQERRKKYSHQGGTASPHYTRWKKT